MDSSQHNCGYVCLSNWVEAILRSDGAGASDEVRNYMGLGLIFPMSSIQLSKIRKHVLGSFVLRLSTQCCCQCISDSLWESVCVSSALPDREPCSICWRNEITIDFYNFYSLRAGVTDEQALVFLPLKTLKNINWCLHIVASVVVSCVLEQHEPIHRD